MIPIIFRKKPSCVQPAAHTAPEDLDDDYFNIPSNEKVKRAVRQLRQTFWIPRPIKEPQSFYVEGQKTYTIIDAIGRSWEVPHKDCYISPTHGKLRELIVQASDVKFKSSNNTTWARTNCPNVSYWSLRLVSKLHYREGSNRVVYFLKWIAISHCLSHLVLFHPSRDPVLWHGNYPPFMYSYHGYPKAARNPLEEQQSEGQARIIIDASAISRNAISTQGSGQHTSSSATSLHSRTILRRLRPSFLNILTKNPDGSYFNSRKNMADWRNENDTDVDPKYIFISYTRDQFGANDMNLLYDMATDAAIDHECNAFWLDNCTQGGVTTDDAREDGDEIYRIADYVRQSYAVVILRGPLASEEIKDMYSTQELRDMLRIWGSRVWTFPEVLLAPNSRIAVYTKVQSRVDLFDKIVSMGGGMDQSEIRADLEPLKKNFKEEIPMMQIADIAWKDASRSGDLVNHFSKNLPLSRLELVSILLLCFHIRELRRQTNQPNGETQKAETEGGFYRADKVYALAGVLRLRPSVDKTDSEFQAFARLSLINDSDRILERFLCMYPKSPSEPWQSMSDAWNVPLWDILPTCQISAIGENDTIIIDGARGASVRWKSFTPVTTFTRPSVGRYFAYLLLHSAGFLFWLGVVLFALRRIKKFTQSTTLNILIPVLGAIHFLLGSPLVISTPVLVKKLAGGKAYGHQAMLFGMEGYEKIEEIERRIWADYRGRLRWSPYGSPLSAHQTQKITGKTDKCQGQTHVKGLDPMSVPKIRTYVDRETTNQGLTLFTLVDTVSMTVFLFLAKRPPIAFLICGQEGGMQRAVGVSYDHTTETVHRETVLRFETTTLQRMSPVPRCRIGFGREGERGWATTNIRPQNENRRNWGMPDFRRAFSFMGNESKARVAVTEIQEHPESDASESV